MWGDYMTLLEAIREAIASFWETVEQTDIIYATYTGDGFRIDNAAMDILLDRVDVPKIYSQQGVEFECRMENGINGKAILKDTLEAGDKVAVAVHHGGQRYSVLYKL